MFFLIMALSQFIPQLQIGYLYTYWGPLGFVLAVTTVREAIDDFRRLVQCPLDTATLDKAAALPIATSTPVTDLRQYIKYNLVYNDLKI